MSTHHIRARVVRLGAACSLVCAVLTATLARAESLDGIFSAGNEAFFRGDYAAAAQQYERLEEAGVRDADVSFNLATAYARHGQLGRAVQHFERALWLRPGDDAAEEGLAAARGLLAKRRADRDGEAELRTEPPLADALVRSLSADGLAIATVVLDALLVALLAGWLLVQRTSVRLALGVGAALTALLGGLSTAGLLVKLDVGREGERVVVVREGAELREGPDAQAKTRGPAHEGELARALERDGSYIRVQLERGARGWLDAKDLGHLRPD
jgi:tetratricopeptide (TPR) repeat protein